MQLANLDSDVAKDYKILQDISSDEEMRRQAEYRDKAWRDEIDRLEGAREEGIKQGKEEGIKQGKEEGIKEGKEEGIKEGIKQGILQVAMNMINAGDSLEHAARITGMSTDEIVKYKESFAI